MNFLRLSPSDLLTSTGKLTFNHSDKTEYGTAYLISEKCSISLYIPRKLGATDVEIAIYNENGTKSIYRENARYLDFTGNLDLYSVKINPEKLGIGLFFGKIKLKTLLGDVFAYKSYDKLNFSTEDNSIAFKITVCDFQYLAPSY
ncbi:MAG: hypothetical protein IJW38_04400, partial [Clostridia bacterium]|nr:hypothetical protein [Clostridia bacterium]